MNFDESILAEYLSNAREHLESLEDDLLELERQKTSPDGELLDKIFRSAHSIKGGAGFLGLKKINRLAHEMENLMSLIRDREIIPTSNAVDALLEARDMLRIMLNQVDKSEEIDISGAIERLKKVAKGGNDRAGTGAPTSPPPAQNIILATRPPKGEVLPVPSPDADISVFSERLSHDATINAVRRHKRICLLKFDLLKSAQTIGHTPIDVVNDLSRSGEVIATKIKAAPVRSADGSTAASFSLYALIGTDLGTEKLHKVSKLVPERIVEVPLSLLNAGEIAPLPVTAAPETLRATVAETAPGETAVKSRPSVQEQEPRTHQHPTVKPTPEHIGSIRINLDVLDKLMTLAGELVLVRNQQLISMNRTDPLIRSIVQRLDQVTSDIQETIIRTRMQPIGNLFAKIPRIVRDLCKKLDKRIEVEISGSDVELDKTILELFGDPITHLIRNCCDHGIEPPEERKALGKPETGKIYINAFHEGGQIHIEIKDDGRGIDPDLVRRKVLEKEIRSERELAEMSDKDILSLILVSGFSTAEKVTEVSGRGVGMDVVKNSIERLGGSLEIDSVFGEGLLVGLRLPLTLAIIPSLTVRAGKYIYAIPQINVQEIVCLYDDDVHTRLEKAGDQEVFRLRERLLPLIHLEDVLARAKQFNREVRSAITEKRRTQREKTLREHLEAIEAGLKENEPMEQALSFAVLKAGRLRYGLIVDEVIGTEEIVVKPMHPSLRNLKCFTGATVMGDGKVALILDVDGMAGHVRFARQTEIEESQKPKAKKSALTDNVQNVLVFRWGPEERYAVSLPMIKRVEHILPGMIEKVGNKEYVLIDGLSTLVVRLDHVLNVSPPSGNERLFLLLPKYMRRPFGILMTRIEGISETLARIRDLSARDECLLGSDIVDGHLTLFPDLYRVIEKVEPDWFAPKKWESTKVIDKKRILLVEDIPYFTQVIRKYLEEGNFEVATAENGRVALEILRNQKFDLIVSDIEMPVMNGINFIKNVRKNPELKHLPAIALTSLSTDKYKDEALKAGFDYYEIKLDRENFLESVAKTLKAYKAA